jgi:hypothetical protein
MIDTIEKTILKKLSSIFKEYEIDSFPVDFEQFVFTSPKGCLLLRYENHSVSEQTTLNAVNANKTYNFTLFAAVRYARKHTDCYQLLTDLERTLNGLTVLNKRISVKNGKFETEINGDLWYSFQINITLPLKDEYSDLSEAAKIIA